MTTPKNYRDQLCFKKAQIGGDFSQLLDFAPINGYLYLFTGNTVGTPRPAAVLQNSAGDVINVLITAENSAAIFGQVQVWQPKEPMYNYPE